MSVDWGKKRQKTRYHWDEKTAECMTLKRYFLRSRKESFLKKMEAKRERKRKRDSDVKMRVTVGTRRVQVGQIWRTEVPYSPRKPASALRPPGPYATSLSVLSFATAIYHLRGPVIPSRLRRKASPIRAHRNTRIWKPREERAQTCAYNRLQTHLLRSYSFHENYWLRHVQGVLSQFVEPACFIWTRDDILRYIKIRISQERFYVTDFT